MGWRGKTSNDVVMVALLQGDGPSTPGEVIERIDAEDWKRAFTLGEGREPISLMGQNIATRLRRLEKADRVGTERVKTTWGHQMAYRPLERGEAEQARRMAWEAAQPTAEDRVLAADLGNAAEVTVELDMIESAVGSHIGIIKVVSNKGSYEHSFYPGMGLEWGDELRELLSLDEAAA